jgi:thymidylate synthase ThyX
MIKAEVVADSKNEFGNRITTMVVTMPRIILAEFNTHRMFSRNSASSRAIPFKKMVKSVEENPFIPIAWQKDHSGMQGVDYITNESHIQDCIDAWLEARNYAVHKAFQLNGDGNVTKQLCNRLLEPFMYHTVIVSATEWENFFALRCPQYKIDDVENRSFRSWKDTVSYIEGNDKTDDSVIEGYKSFNPLERLKKNIGQAEIHMMTLAEAMWDAYNESTPQLLKAGEWHIPYNNLWMAEGGYPKDLFTIEEQIALGTVRAARTSYTVVGEDQKPMSIKKVIELHDKLVTANPLHASPMEHCAQVPTQRILGTNMMGNDHNYWSGNFKGFTQYRKMFANENITI